MRILSSIVARFVGGQAEIRTKENLLRGEIQSIRVGENNTLRLRFVWIAKGEGYPLSLTRWIKDDRHDYAAHLELYTVSGIDPITGKMGFSNRLKFTSKSGNESITLFPANGDKLDPTHVQRLESVVTA